MHDYRIQKIKHDLIFGWRTALFYRKRRYVCEKESCGKQFYEDNALVERLSKAVCGI
nr:transposase [Virgibacillus pantothenticus]